MSYALEVKRNLLQLSVSPCCKIAELYGFLLFSNRCSETELRIVSAYPEISARYLPWLKEAGVTDYMVSFHGEKFKTQVLVAAQPSQIRALLVQMGNCSFASPLRINFGLLELECCQRAFLRGVFLACGGIGDPQKSHFVELRTSHHILASDFTRLCEELSLYPGTSLRRGKKIIYWKSIDAIQDFLTMIGATGAVLDYANAEILKNIRNGVNRVSNCDSANADKIVSAAGKQLRAIRFLEKNGYFYPNEALAQIARLRVEFPEETLEVLGSRCQPPLSKSGASHRMRKICEIANAMEEKVR